MKKWVMILVAVLVLVFIVFFTTDLAYLNKYRSANYVINELEEYYLNFGQYPNSFEDIGMVVTESGPIYYEKINKDRYFLYFGTTLGEGKYYDSKIKKWSDFPKGIY